MMKKYINKQRFLEATINPLIPLPAHLKATQTSWAKELNVSTVHLSNMLNGKYGCALEYVERISELTGYDVDYLYGESDYKTIESLNHDVTLAYRNRYTSLALALSAAGITIESSEKHFVINGLALDVSSMELFFEHVSKALVDSAESFLRIYSTAKGNNFDDTFDDTFSL